MRCPAHFLTAAIPVFGALVLSACATPAPKVRVDTIEGSLPQCQTFAWNPAPEGDATSLTDQRVRTAVMQTLQTKGYAEATEKADCRIAYQLSTQHVEAPKPRVGVGMGGGSGGSYGGVGISLPIGKHKAGRGTFTIDVIDSAKNAQVWSGSLDASLDTAQASDQEINEAVKEVLAKFPDRTASPN